jgi:phosphopantetheinyl transferase (holo-ACP synthase)
MLGNDVVDLRDPDTRPETFRPRFDERVFDVTERRAIEHDEDSHARRWIHWAAKEAAYKLARQIDDQFVFSPGKLIARFEAAESAEYHRRTRRGAMTLPVAPAVGFREIELRGIETPEYVHVIALPMGGDWDAVVSSVEPLADETDASEAVRVLAASGVARDLGIDASRVAIGRRGRIPTVEIDGARSTMAISLSHHGGYVASAVSPRCDEGLLADEAGEGHPDITRAAMR